MLSFEIRQREDGFYNERTDTQDQDYLLPYSNVDDKKLFSNLFYVGYDPLTLSKKKKLLYPATCFSLDRIVRQSANVKFNVQH